MYIAERFLGKRECISSHIAIGRYDMERYRKTALFRRHGYTTDSGLLSRIAEADEQAWRDFYEKYRSMIIAIGQNRGFNQIECEDLVQEVMFVCCRRIGQLFFYDRSKGHFRSWLTAVIRNISWQQQRKNRQPEPDELPDYDDGINLSFMQEYENFLLESCLKLLRQRVSTQTYAAFEMLCIQQLPTEEVSRITRKSPAVLYLIRYRCLRILRQCIEQIPEAAERIHSRKKPEG